MATILLPGIIDKQYDKHINELAPDYELLRYSEIENNSQLEQVELMIGWPKELGDQLLTHLETGKGRLKWIQTYSAGVDYLDLERLQKNQVLLSNASGVHINQISESVLAMVLAHYRGILPSYSNQSKQLWQPMKTLKSVANANMLIVGTGKIGQQLAKVAAPLGINVYGINRSGGNLPYFIQNHATKEINQVLPEMDIVVNILPYTKETHHFFDEERFAYMKQDVTFVNVGRGETVATDALIAACQNKKIGLAALDVFEEEPLLNNSPLWQLENVLITPHISGLSTDYLEKFMAIFLRNLATYVTDNSVKENLVNYELGY